jgi:hypothetical protein
MNRPFATWVSGLGIRARRSARMSRHRSRNAYQRPRLSHGEGICARDGEASKVIQEDPHAPPCMRPHLFGACATLLGDFRHWRRRGAKPSVSVGSYRASASCGANFVGPQNIWDCRNSIGPFGIRNRRQALGADVRSKPPNHLVGPIRRVVPGDLQPELIWNFDLPSGAKPDAPVACVDDEAENHLAAVRRLQSCHAFERVARRLALVLELFGFWRRHARALVDHFRDNQAWAPCDGPNRRARIFRSFVEISRTANLCDGALPVFSVPCIVPRNDLRPSMADKRRDQISVPLDPDLRAQLEQRAREEDRPLAALIRLLCRQGLQQHREHAA